MKKGNYTVMTDLNSVTNAGFYGTNLTDTGKSLKQTVSAQPINTEENTKDTFVSSKPKEEKQGFLNKIALSFKGNKPAKEESEEPVSVPSIDDAPDPVPEPDPDELDDDYPEPPEKEFREYDNNYDYYDDDGDILFTTFEPLIDDDDDYDDDLDDAPDPVPELDPDELDDDYPEPDFDPSYSK